MVNELLLFFAIIGIVSGYYLSSIFAGRVQSTLFKNMLSLCPKRIKNYKFNMKLLIFFNLIILLLYLIFRLIDNITNYYIGIPYIIIGITWGFVAIYTWMAIYIRTYKKNIE